MASQKIRFVITLGVISAVGPFSVDMYLSTFPSIAAGFGVSGSAVQFTLVAYFLAMAVGQPIYGPVSDMVGRKPPLFVGLVLFFLASLGCALATSIQMLIAMRFLQGLGACAGMVISRAVVRDVFRGSDAVRLLSGILLVISVSPILAPLAGSSIAAFASWRWVFGALTIIALGSMSSALWLLPETLPPERRQARSMGAFFSAYARLARDGRFLALVLLGGFTQGVLYAYLGGAPLLFIKTFGVPPLIFSVIFAVNAIGMIGLAQFNAPLVRRFGGPAVVIFGCGAGAALLTPLAILSLLGPPNFVLVLVLLFMGFATVGLIGGPNTMIALESQTEGVGAASSMMGALQFTLGALASATVGVIPGPTERGMFSVMAFCAIMALAIALVVLGRGGATRPA
jgi:DHA1 family bicyclomycin/chloramphenicol resistance-like MFS transporter